MSPWLTRNYEKFGRAGLRARHNPNTMVRGAPPAPELFGTELENPFGAQASLGQVIGEEIRFI
jgi:hypothetical protein